MKRLVKKHRNESIEMQAKRFGYFPQAFLWHGRRYRVKRVERAWTVSRNRPRRRVEQRFFRVHTAEGIFDLYQDLVANTWHLARVLA
ncbi:MAG: hypothetical protein B6I34_04870 [Anaerolineaceae bacterium 4572_32.1]|nr:MAG: hypothetical protein B6I34_04870 [Anaerolineaceae bacterium 4572_32.1]